jgi:hypothetical protein
MSGQVEERVEVLGVERELPVRAAVSAAMVGLLVGLSAFFVTFAPGM